jgi:hypothetical protein
MLLQVSGMLAFGCMLVRPGSLKKYSSAKQPSLALGRVEGDVCKMLQARLGVHK